MSYIANKHNMANITNIHYYDTVGGAWSANLLGVALPYNLLPAAPAAGDVVVFGIDTSLPDSGPFCSLVFDLMTAQNDLTTVTWRYSDAGVDPTAWAAANVQDNTDSDGQHTGNAFDTTGVKSVHWSVIGVMASNWVDTIDPTIGGNALGVTGYWVCAHVVAVGGAPTAPVQQNRHPYTITWAFLEMLADDVAGDVPALVSLSLRNQSDYYFMASGAPELFSNRVLVGLRSYDRGPNFTCYINLADEQNPSGITVTDNPASYIFTDDPAAPTGRKIRCTNIPVSPGSYMSTIQFGPAILTEFAGRYRLFLRMAQDGGSPGDITFYLTINFGYFFYRQWTPYVATTRNDGSWELIDFGPVMLPPASDILDSEYGDLYIRIWAIGDGAIDADLFDIILLPIDEWCADVLAVDVTNKAIMSGLGCRGAMSLNSMLDINSLVVPRRIVRSLLKNYSSGQVMKTYSSIASGPPIAQANTRQRFWFVQTERSTDSQRGARPEVTVSATVNKVQRYFSMRGGR